MVAVTGPDGVVHEYTEDPFVTLCGKPCNDWPVLLGGKTTCEKCVAALTERGRLIEALRWALDLIDRYDEFLIELGEPRERVHSDIHVAGKAKARAALMAQCAEEPWRLDLMPGVFEMVWSVRGAGEGR